MLFCLQSNSATYFAYSTEKGILVIQIGILDGALANSLL